HFWPGNAIGIRAPEPVPIGRWTHVAIAYDGSSRAAGLALYVDGRKVACEVIRDKLTKNITGGGNDLLTLGPRFPEPGGKAGLVDEIQVSARTLTPLESAQLLDGKSLTELLSLDSGRLTDAQRNGLFAYSLANGDAEYRNRLGALTALRKERSALVDPVPELM